MESTYSVVFAGEVLEGRDATQVRASLGELFSLAPERVERLFSGRKVILKRGLQRAAAVKFRAALARAGAVVMLHEETADVTASASRPAQARPVAAQPRPAPSPSSIHEQQANTLSCPRCGHEQTVAESCGHCRMDLRLHLQRLARRERAQQARLESRSA